MAEYSWYGPGFYGSGTACGQRYSRSILGVAHRSLPCGTRVTLRNPANGRSITVRVIDRGPYVSGRLWDLSRGDVRVPPQLPHRPHPLAPALAANRQGGAVQRGC